MQGPEGRPANVSPARKGWEIDPEEDPSAVGAALNRCFSTDPSAVERSAVSLTEEARRPYCSPSPAEPNNTHKKAQDKSWAFNPYH
jgi:hypothetical protein